MSVRKRTWITSRGETKSAFIADYTDRRGTRHIKTFARRKDAEAYSQQVGVAVRAGTHTPESLSLTVKQAADSWLQTVERHGRERTTLAQYKQHVDLHIVPRLGTVKLAKLTTPKVHEFVDDLVKDLDKKRPTVRKVLTSLKAIMRHAHGRGYVAQNVAADVRLKTSKRDKAQLRAGIDIPTPDEIRRLIAAASGQTRVLLIVAIGTGLRASELRGLCWDDVDLDKRELHVRQRADAYRAIGAPKSAAGQRAIPIGPQVLNTLREWKLRCPKGEARLVFPNANGGVQHYKDVERALDAVLIEAGVVDADGKPKYSLHAFRHFFASWCINPQERGGRGLSPKIVQHWLGHSSIALRLIVTVTCSNPKTTGVSWRRPNGSCSADGQRSACGAPIATPYLVRPAGAHPKPFDQPSPREVGQGAANGYLLLRVGQLIKLRERGSRESRCASSIVSNPSVRLRGEAAECPPQDGQ